MDLSNKDRILNLLKLESLTSKEIAKRLSLSEQDTRTYLLRLKKEDNIKTLGKKGRFYIYTYKMPFDTTILSFKDEINKKISELEARVNIITSKPTKIEEELEIFEPPSSQMLAPSYSNLDDVLKQLLVAIPEVKAAAIVDTEGLPIATALPQGVDETRIASIIANLYSLAERAVIEMKEGEFEQLYVRGKEGYLLVLAAGPNAVLAVSTTRDVRLGLIFLDCMRTCEKIAKLI